MRQLGRKLRQSDAPALGLVLLFFVLLHWQVVLGGRHWLFGDNSFQNFPWHYYVWDHVRHGGLVAPCPEMSLGFPLYAEPQAQVFYPFNTALWPIDDVFVSFTLKMLLHMLSAVVGMYFLARFLGRGRSGAAAAAVVLAGSGFMIYRVVHSPILFSLAWMPWIVLLYLRALRGQSGLALAGLVGCAAMQILSGHPQVAVYTAITCLLLTGAAPAAEGTSRGWRGRLRPLGLLAGAYAGGALLATVQLVPAYELYLYGSRVSTGDSSLVRQFGCSLRDLAVDFVSRAPADWKWEKIAFPGSLAWVAVLYGLFAWRDRQSRLLLLLVALGLLLSWSDTNPLYEIMPYVPGLNRLRGAGRIGLLLTFGAALLFARLVDEARQPAVRRLAGTVLATFALLEGVTLAATGSAGFGDFASAPLNWQAAALAGALAAVLSAARSPRLARALPAALTVLAGLELLLLAQGVNTSYTRQQWEALPAQRLYEAASRRCRDTGSAFVYWREGLGNNVAINYGVAQPRCYTPMAPPAVDAINTLFFGPNTAAQLAAFNIGLVACAQRDTQQATLQPVERIGDLLLCRAPLPPAGAYMPAELLPGDIVRALEVLRARETDPRRTVVLPEAVVGGQPVSTPGGRAELREQAPSRLVVQTTAPQAGVVVVPRLWTANWTASVDGTPAPALQANVVLLAAAVPAGEHTVVFEYRPEMLRPALVSALLALCWLVWLGRGFVQGRGQRGGAT